MIWIVVTINLLLSLGLMWSTWQVWKLRAAFAATADSVDSWAAASQKGLSVSPPAILIVQKRAGVVKTHYWAFLPQIQRIQMVLFTLGRVQSLIRGMHIKSRHRGKVQPGQLRRSDLHVKRRR